MNVNIRTAVGQLGSGELGDIAQWDQWDGNFGLRHIALGTERSKGRLITFCGGGGRAGVGFAEGEEARYRLSKLRPLLDLARDSKAQVWRMD